MASIKVCFAVGFFMIALSPTGLSEDVPDDVVYTEIKKTLVNGTKGVLTCQFKGTPNAVYWIKGSGTDIDLSFITWAYGSKSGPKYEDGSCDMDENYSLIINDVTYADAGRYICEVSSYKGFLIYNYTDVIITSKGVKTQQRVAFQMGEVGVLPCQVSIRPKMVSWLKGVNTTLVTTDLSGDGTEKRGTGYNQGLFNITKEYSLVINDVTIQHEDKFSCEVTDFDTDKVYTDVTLLTVFAQPTKPFPVIQECPMADQSNCIITTDSSVMLTCHVNQYYPDINLVFMHGSERVESFTTFTGNNTDGTKNKSITISADISHDVYKCIASGIPGLDLNDERTSSVRLIQHVREQSNSAILAVLIVPIVICLTMVLLAWLRLRKRRTQFFIGPVSVHIGTQDEKSDGTGEDGKGLSTEESYMEDHITYVELWKLVEYIVKMEATPELADLITLLNGNHASWDMDQKYYYQELCRWKESCDQTINLRTTLYEKCREVGLLEALQYLEEFRHNTSSEMPPSDFEHILWHISEPFKIRKFLVGLGMKTEAETEQPQKKKIVEEAVQKLKQWETTKMSFLNPVIMISSTMEMLGYCTADNNFFQIPNEEKDNLHDNDLHRFARNLTSSHWQTLKGIIKCNGGIIQSINPNENTKVLFDFENMLRDWWDEMECSNYNKRRTLQRLSGGLSDKSKPPGDHYFSDEELKVIARYLNPASMAHVCKKLHIDLNEDAEEKERFEVLHQWRTSVNETEWTTAYDQLRSSLREVGVLGLLQPLRNDAINKAEYMDIAFDLLMTDVLPVAKALGIEVNKFPAYRPIFEASHLEKGTIGLVANLVESTTNGQSRLVLCSRLRESGFPPAIAMNMLVSHMTYGELRKISNAMREEDCRLGANDTTDDEEKEPGEGENMLNSDKIASTDIKIFINGSKEEDIRSNRHFTEMKKMLQLTDEELGISMLPSKCLDEFTLFKIWKQMPHPAGFNERAAIIQGLFEIERPDIARSVIEGKFYGREGSLDFIKYIIKKMNKPERERFATAMTLNEEDLAGHGSAEVISETVSGILKDPKSNSLIEKLVENGFLDIACELNIVQQ